MARRDFFRIADHTYSRLFDAQILSAEACLEEYEKGKAPIAAQFRLPLDRIDRAFWLVGTLDVVMWDRWSFMRRDFKVFLGDYGFNVYQVAGKTAHTWGWFDVEEGDGCIVLNYRDGKTIDFVRVSRKTRNVFPSIYGKRGKKKKGDLFREPKAKRIAPFALVRRAG